MQARSAPPHARATALRQAAAAEVCTALTFGIGEVDERSPMVENNPPSRTTVPLLDHCSANASTGTSAVGASGLLFRGGRSRGRALLARSPELGSSGISAETWRPSIGARREK